MFRELSLAYGWTPSEIETLTAPQLSWYLSSEPRETARWIAPVEARHHSAARRAARDAWVQAVMETLNRGLPTT